MTVRREARRCRTFCPDCGKTFFPYGGIPIIPPLMDDVKCPYCGYKGRVVWDDELDREIQRKKLGLDKDLEDRVKWLELENKTLRVEFEALKKKIDDNTEIINQLNSSIGELIPLIRKQVAEALEKFLENQDTNKKINPLST
jgi:DNA-directed RNA polymerase subunit RPC12/RpoP